MIHESYGNDLDMTTDEEDNHQKQSNNSTPDQTSPKQENNHVKFPFYLFNLVSKY
jgi:hypothetical protein